ncbi:MAG: MFS transporter [Candidatus Margulisbacteria bacterium]|nr:MFS transporter [Candidatus Margulisiibacteriota bacterium]
MVEISDQSDIQNTGTLPPHPGASFAKVLSNFGFLWLWFGQLNSQLADRVFVYVLMIIAYNLTGTNLGVSIPLLAFGIPSLLFGPLAGVFVDKWDRKTILVITSIIRGALVLLVVPLIDKSLGSIFAVSFLIYTVTQFFAPAETASIPELVKKHDLIVANSLFMITWMGASVIGFGLGAPLVNFFGNEGTFLVAAVLYFVAAVSVSLVRLKPVEHEEKHKNRPIREDLFFGLEFIRRNKVVMYSLLKLFVATAAIAIISLLAISYAKDVLGIGAKNFGYLIIAVGVGMFVGMGLLERLSRLVTKGAIVILSFIVSGIALILIGSVTDLKAALLLIALLGVGNIFIVSSIQTILQHRIPRNIRGRVFGVQNMLINSAFVFPVILSGFAADIYGVKTTLMVLGYIVAFTGVAGIFLPRFRDA